MVPPMLAMRMMGGSTSYFDWVNNDWRMACSVGFLFVSFHGKNVIAICGFKDLFFGSGINEGFVVSEVPSTHSMYD